MPKYRVKVLKHFEEVYEVEAENEDDAYEEANNGSEEPVENNCIHQETYSIKEM